MFSKILVPIDGSENSYRALEVAIDIAKRYGSKLTLLYVSSVSIMPIVSPETPFIPYSPIVNPSDFLRIVDAEKRAAEDILSKCAESASKEGVEVEKVIREGHAVHEIVELAKEGDFDLIVMGARGTSKIRELLLGSVSEGVVRNAPCNVLIVKKVT
jgi:nucleotide-binding universal stress UspA family protein